MKVNPGKRPTFGQIDLILLRHGESEGDVANREYHKGNTALRDITCSVSTYCHRLTPHGEQQAAQIGRMLADEFPHIHYCETSDMVRTVETTLIVHDLLKHKPTIRPRSDHQERSWGAAEWETGEQGERHRNVHQQRAFFRPTEWHPERGEAGISVHKRAHDVIYESIRDQPVCTLKLVVSHGEMMWHMDSAIRRRSAVHVSHHDQVNREIPHNCGVWHYRIDTRSDFRMVRRTSIAQPTTFSPWEVITPEPLSTEDLWKYVRSNKRLIS